VKELGSLTPAISSRVRRKIEALGASARPPGVKKLEGEPPLWRIRVGDWRVIYSIDDKTHTVDIIYIRHRSSAYD